MIPNLIISPSARFAQQFVFFLCSCRQANKLIKLEPILLEHEAEKCPKFKNI